SPAALPSAPGAPSGQSGKELVFCPRLTVMPTQSTRAARWAFMFGRVFDGPETTRQIQCGIPRPTIFSPFPEAPDQRSRDTGGREQHRSRLGDCADVNPRATGAGIQRNKGRRRIGDRGRCGGPLILLRVDRLIQVDVQGGYATRTPDNRKRRKENGTTRHAPG